MGACKMKLQLKYLGIGFFLAGAIFSVSSHFSIPFLSAEEKQVKTDTALKKELEQSQVEIKELKEQIAKLEASHTEDQSSTDEGEKEATNDTNSSSEQTASTIVEATIYIYEDLSLYDIGKQAEDLKLVKNGRELELFLSKREYARSVQKGQFDLNSSMTIEEIANIITGKKKDE